MDFGGGFAVGMAAGIGSGMAIGASDASKKGRSAVKRHIEENGITLLDRYGKPIKLDDFFAEMGDCSTQCKSKTKVWCLAMVALVATLALGVLGYLVLAN